MASSETKKKSKSGKVSSCASLDAFSAACVVQSTKEPSVKRKKTDDAVIPARDYFFNNIAIGVRALMWSFLDVRTWYVLRRVNNNFSLTFRGLSRAFWETAMRHEHAMAVSSVGHLEDEDVAAEFKKHTDDIPVRCTKCNKVYDASVSFLVVKIKDGQCDTCDKADFYAAMQSKMSNWRLSRLVAETTLAHRSTARLRPKHTFSKVFSTIPFPSLL